MSDEEVWRTVLGFDDYYRISSHGRVKSLKGNEKILKTRPNNRGYYQVGLRRDGKQIFRTVHSLVLENFVSRRPKGMDIDHFDSDPSNNRLDNLRYITKSDNIKRSKSGLDSDKDFVPHKNREDYYDTLEEAREALRIRRARKNAFYKTLL